MSLPDRSVAESSAPASPLATPQADAGEDVTATEREVACDPTLPNSMSPSPHDYSVVGEDEGSLADGGSYDVLVCRRCGRRAYRPLAD